DVFHLRFFNSVHHTTGIRKPFFSKHESILVGFRVCAAPGLVRSTLAAFLYVEQGQLLQAKSRWWPAYTLRTDRSPVGSRCRYSLLPRRGFSGRHQQQHDHQARSEEHTSELQSRENLVCRLLLEK